MFVLCVSMFVNVPVCVWNEYSYFLESRSVTIRIASKHHETVGELSPAVNSTYKKSHRVTEVLGRKSNRKWEVSLNGCVAAVAFAPPLVKIRSLPKQGP